MFWITPNLTCHTYIHTFTYIILGEGFLQGGWILFDREGIPKAAFQENAKQRVQIDDILKEVLSMRGTTEQPTNDESKK